MQSTIKLPQTTYRPLDEIGVKFPHATLFRALDGDGQAYHEGAGIFRVSGALGTHTLLGLDAEGRLVGSGSFRVEAKTEIRDKKHRFGPMLDNLAFTMVQSCQADGNSQVMIDGKIYRFYICWLRDHTHTFKGMQYFDGDSKSAVDLYADTQRNDGMVYDLIHPKNEIQGWRDHVFSTGDFIRTLDSGRLQQYSLQRIPVENDVEFLFVECLFRTWRTTGDTDWMASHLDNAIRAVVYATTDARRWSTKFKLLKRGYTIDTWDFMHEADARLSGGENLVNPDKTVFGIMHGDNTGMAASCRYLATMLRAAGRKREAPTFERLADQLLRRLDKVAWNGHFYQHHISEHSEFKRDIGNTDETKQVTLSNAYALDRGIGEDKCRAIIETYQRIRSGMPESSPGEWYNCYPPFERGFDAHAPQWQYMNGGVSMIVAGELARGAFLHGAPEYGADILLRVKELADRHGGYLHVCFNGNPQTHSPKRKMTCLDLSKQATVSATWKPSGGWGEKNNDLSRLPIGHQVFCGVPFSVSGNGIGIGNAGTGFSKEISIPIGSTCGSVYLLHTSRNSDLVGEFEVRYQDGTSLVKPIQQGAQVGGWFMPMKGPSRYAAQVPRGPQGWPEYQLAWNGPNRTYQSVGVFVWGWNNPHPDKPIESLVFRAPCTNAQWWIPAVTVSDAPVWFPPSDLSYGIPDAWGSAAVVTALLEGLVGVRDDDIAMRKVTVSPQWSLTGETEASATVKYEASGGYVSYRWTKTGKTQKFLIALSGDSATVRLPVPTRTRRLLAEVNGQTITPNIKDGFIIVPLSGRCSHQITLREIDK